MYKFISIIFLGMLSSLTAHALDVKPGAPLNRGNPTVIVDVSGSDINGTTLQRRGAGAENWQLLNIDDYDVQQISNNIYRFIDKSVTVDTNSPEEYQYKINDTLGGTDNAWAASCEGYDEAVDPLQTWVATINLDPFHIGSTVYQLVLTATGATNEIVLPAPSETTQLEKQKGFYILSNDKYIAIFSGRGGLLALTHRTYGMEFQKSLRNPFISPISVQYGCDANGSNCEENGVWQQAPNFPPTDQLNINNELVFEWTINGANILVYWSLDSFDRSGLHGRLEVLNGDDTFERILFPLIIGLGYEPGCLPSNPGQCASLHRPSNVSGITQLLSEPRSGSYPNSSLSAQFVAVSKSNSVLYFGAEDPTGFPKKYLFFPTSSTSGSGIDHYLRDNYEIKGTQPYDVVIRPMCGTWNKAAKMYRNWAVNQEWTPEKLFDRVDVSDDLKSGMFWWTHNNGKDKDLTFNLNYLNNTLKPLLRDMDNDGNIRLGIHHYNWHTPEFDHGYPEYTPKCLSGTSCTSADWSSYLQSAQQDSQTWVMPYINGTNIDVSNMPSGLMSNACLASNPDPVFGLWQNEWPAGSGNIISDDLVYLENGLPSTTAFSTQQCLGKMDLNSLNWQSIIQDLATVNFNSGVAAQYLDTLGSGYSPNYNNAIPSYQPGHSQYWKYGTRSIANAVKAAAVAQGSSKFTAAEHYSELYLKNIDLITMYTSQPPTLIPMLPSVYSGYHLVAGMQLRSNDNEQARKYRLSLPFLWGYQPGLTTMKGLVGINPSSTIPCDAINHSACDYSSASYAFNLAKARENTLDIFNYGEFIGAVLPELSSDYILVTDWCEDFGCSIKQNVNFPLIQAAHWHDKNNDDIVVMTNPTSTSQSIALELPMSLRGRNVNCVDFKGVALNCLIAINEKSVSVTMNNLSVTYLVFDVWSDPDKDLIDSHFDNCPNDANPQQNNNDSDTQGDLCDADDDNDGLTDVIEGILGTDPFLADTDGDGVPDGLEVEAGTDPTNDLSFPLLHNGDANNDGEVNTADLLLAMRILLGQITATPLQLAKLDVAPLVTQIPEPDGVFNLADYVVLLRKVTGLINF